MQAIILAQGKQQEKEWPVPLKYAVTAQENGYIHAIDNLKVAKIASLAGAPIDKYAGIDLSKKVGDNILKGETLFTIYACFKSEFKSPSNKWLL